MIWRGPFAKSSSAVPDHHHRELLEVMNRSHDWHDLDRYVQQEMINAISGDDLKSAVSTNFNAVKMGLNTLSDLKSELVDILVSRASSSAPIWWVSPFARFSKLSKVS